PGQSEITNLVRQTNFHGMTLGVATNGALLTQFNLISRKAIAAAESKPVADTVRTRMGQKARKSNFTGAFASWLCDYKSRNPGLPGHSRTLLSCFCPRFLGGGDVRQFPLHLRHCVGHGGFNSWPGFGFPFLLIPGWSVCVCLVFVFHFVRGLFMSADVSADKRCGRSKIAPPFPNVAPPFFIGPEFLAHFLCRHLVI